MITIGTTGATAEQGVCLLPNRDGHLEAMTKLIVPNFRGLKFS